MMFPGPLDSFDPTEKQAEIIRTLFEFADKGEFPRICDLQEALSYGPKVTTQAIRCSLEALQRHGAIELVYGDEHGSKVRGRKIYVKPTPACWRRFRPMMVIST